ncbi:glutathionylspermidine synthase family protein [Williamsia sp. CHRR-6]|uniref:glutathionylspermidine synthase family protein n=1 Tax=Williamsia sp. CHRR-6 TaxID=2835871 RepID=UPI001BD96CDD|nr:glutathionylspermidine synthase family protein [Williamsia sp. CHRR-6]MBT0567340.1 glutathionylspermidine synthase family protein [Williamsia sp. CHRR-6]
MRRLTCAQRPDWTALVQSQGLVYTRETDPSDPFHHYWREGVYYSFTLAEIELLEEAARCVFDMCVEAGDWMTDPANRDVLSQIGIPAYAHDQVIASWDPEPAFGSIYGRFDFRFGGLDHPDPALRVPQLYEFNADTPTSLVESATIQWLWLEQTGHGRDQWNLIYEMLVDAWRRNLRGLGDRYGLGVPTVHFAIGAGQGSFEDEMNTLLLRDACAAAGFDTATIEMEDIVLGDDGRFYDEADRHIDVIFKLYPWEFMVEERFGPAAFADMATVGRRSPDGTYTGGTVWIEPPYKMLWSNKGLLAVLWARFADDPRSKFLIPSYFESDAPPMSTGYARKPLLSREGANLSLVDADGKLVVPVIDREYGGEGFIIQNLALPPEFRTAASEPVHPVLGLWMVDGEPAGMGIRESTSPVTDDFANFVPHSISDGELRYAPADSVVSAAATESES